jgi:oligopeptide transport system permease protein
MARYMIYRVLSMFLTLFIIITITFFLMHAVPGGPYDYEGQNLSPEAVKALQDKYKLNDPILKQYADYLREVASFDLGPSYYYSGRTVTEVIAQGFPVTFSLSMVSLALVFVLSVPLGISAALRRNRWQDRLILLTATLGRTIPVFVLGTVFIYFFSYQFKLFPIYGIGTWKHYVLPAIALSMGSISHLTRLNRSSMLDVISQDYIRTAYAKGLTDFKVIYKHALKNASIPMATVLGSRIAALMTGSFVIEQIFAMPGIGRYFIQAISNRDYPLIMGITIYFSVIVLVAMLVVDLVYGLLDPRVALHRKGASK